MKPVQGSILAALVTALLGFGVVLHSQESSPRNDSAATPVPTFQPPALVVPAVEQEAGTATDSTAAGKKDHRQRNISSAGSTNPSATDDQNYIPSQAPVTPRMSHETLDSSDLSTVHLRPLFTTGIKLPDEVTAIAVGAPSLVWAEHDRNVPRLIFVKPVTNAPIDTDIIVSLKSGATLTIHAISPGEKGSDDPVDFMVDYSGQNSLLRSEAQPASLFRNHVGEESSAQADLGADAVAVQPRVSVPVSADPPATTALAGDDREPAEPAAQASFQQPSLHPVNFDPANAAAAGEVRTSTGRSVLTVPGTLLESMYEEQVSLATPKFLNGTDLAHVYPADKKATDDLAVSFGRMVQQGDTMTFSYSVQNRSDRWIEIMPPHLEFADPRPKKPSKKHPTAITEQLTVDDYILTATKLAPGERVDGAIQFERPSFKYKKQLLMLEVASASEVDTALLVPVPFTTQFGTN